MICRILVFGLLPALLFAATPETDPMEIFNLLAFGGVGQMKYKIGGEPGGEAIDVDDTDWEIASPGFKWALSNTNIWFRTKIKIQEKIGGFSLAGRSMTLYLYIDNGGDVFVNGDSLGTFRWGTEVYEISPELQVGDEFLLAIRAINGPGFGKIYDARIEFSGMVDFQQKLQKKVWGLYIARRLARELSSKPEKWLSEIDRVARNVVESPAFKAGDEAGLLATFDKEAEALQGLKDEMQEKFEIYCAGYAHIDLAWMWDWQETVEVTRNTSQSVLNLMEKFPDFKYSMGQAHAYEWMEIYMPEIFEKVKQRAKENRWEIMGGMWVEPDCNLPSGESFVRQVLYGKNYFRKKFNKNVKVCWIPDSFGFNWNLPQILARAGFDAFVTHKINWNDTNKFPYRFFWWEAPDCSRIMTYIPRSGYGHDLNGDQLIDYVKEEQGELNFGKELVLYGRGDHGGGPSLEMLERAEVAKRSPAFPVVKQVTSEEFFNSITPDEKARLPVWDSELYLEYHRGTYTSQAKTKKHNRQGEGMITTTEKLATIASRHGYEYPQSDIFHVWRTLLFNQFHDILPGSSINPVYHDTEIEYAESQALTRDIQQQAFRALAEKIDTRGEGEALVIFNPLSWVRTSPVEFALNRIDAKQNWSVLDENGKVIPVQVIDESVLGSKLLFLAEAVPAFGYKVYRLVAKKSAGKPDPHLKATETQLQNKFLEVKLDPQTGLMTKVIDLVNDFEVLAKPEGNLLQLLPNEMKDAWNLRFIKPAIDLKQAKQISLVEDGPVRKTIKVVHTYLGEQKHNSFPVEDYPSSFFTQYISLYAGIPHVEVRNQVKWWEECKVLKVAFPVNIQSKTARFEIPYGSIARSTGFETSFEKARFEVPAQRWADLSDGQNGVSLINDSKYGYDIKGNMMRLTLLRAPQEPDPMCDRGYHEFKYALYPHAGDFVRGKVTQRAIEFNEPFSVFRTDAHKGVLPRVHGFATVLAENVILNSMKLAEDGTGWILRVYENAGKAATAEISLSEKIEFVEEVNLMEEKIEPVKFSQDKFQFEIKPHEIRTFRVTLK